MAFLVDQLIRLEVAADRRHTSADSGEKGGCHSVAPCLVPGISVVEIKLSLRGEAKPMDVERARGVAARPSAERPSLGPPLGSHSTVPDLLEEAQPLRDA